jgi:hypothetical protein
MNRRQLLRTLTLSALGTGSCLSSSSQPASATVAIRVSRPISVGETFQYDNDLKIIFGSMIDDSRCPVNAKCVSEGDAEVLLRIKVGKEKYKNYWLHTQTRPKKLEVVFVNPTNGSVKTYIIDIATLDPRPYVGKKFRQSDYRLALHITERI